MRLSKSDALLVSQVLFSIKNSEASSHVEAVTADRLDALQEMLTHYLSFSEEDGDLEMDATDDEADYDDDQDDASELSDDEAVDDFEVDDCVSVDTLVSLSPCKIVVGDARCTLEFDESDVEVDGQPAVDCVMDHDIITGMTALKLEDGAIHLWFAEEVAWRTYKFARKAPSSWVKLLGIGAVIGVTANAADADEDE